MNHSNNINNDNILNSIHDRNSLQQLQITELTIYRNDVQYVHRANGRPTTVV